MKNLFIVYFDIYNSSFFGVRKKLLWQVRAMCKNGLETELAYRSGKKVIIVDSNENVLNEYTYTNFWYRNGVYQALKQHFKQNRYASVYIRFPGLIDFSFYKTLKFFKMRKAKVFLEIPTYPIGGEIKNYYEQLINEKKYFILFFKLLSGIIHKIFSRQIGKFVDRVVTFMPYKKVWGIEVIEIDNGVSLSDINIVNKSKKQDFFKLVGVANVDIWHGYDRLLRGIAKYKAASDIETGKRIVFNIVGTGRELENLKNLTKDLKLEENVNFLGMKDGEELNGIFNDADIAVSSLGMHRIGVIDGSTLKTKEYCARGIPFIYAYNEKKIPEDFKYALKITANEKDINIKSIISFYDSVCELNNYSNEMRNFARENFTWDRQMLKVVSSILERN